MVGCKRIWLACLLAIAGSGPLPLWLHQIVCHGPHGHGHYCSHSLAHSSGQACGQHTHQACAAHVHAAHSPAAGQTASNGVAHAHRATAHAAGHDARTQHRRALRLSSHGDDHDCAACYALSQPNLVAKVCTVALVVTALPACPLASPEHPDSVVVSAYSSRAPPAV